MSELRLLLTDGLLEDSSTNDKLLIAFVA